MFMAKDSKHSQSIKERMQECMESGKEATREQDHQPREEEEENGIKTHKDREVDLVIKTLKNREGEVNRKETLKWDRYLSLMYEKGNKPKETTNKEEFFS